MTRILLAIAIALTCSHSCFAMSLDANGPAKFTAFIFNGAAAIEKFNGQIPQEHFLEWFTQDFQVGGERIETPLDAEPIGGLVLQDGKQLILMPICTWTLDSGTKYFACQSEAIGMAPKFSICVADVTADEFLERMREKLTGLTKQHLSLDQRADAAVAEIKRIREVAKLGVASSQVNQELGQPNSVSKFDSGTIAETWRYDIDETVYILVNYDANSLVIGSSSSGIKELIGSED